MRTKVDDYKGFEIYFDTDEGKFIIEGSKTIAKYLEWIYVPHNDLQNFPKAGYWRKTLNLKGTHFIKDVGTCKFVCRNHNQLRFYNSMDALIPAIEKLENEDLSEFHYEWEDSRGKNNNFMSLDFNRWYNESHYSIDLELDPAIFIGSHKGEGILKDTFHATVEAINYINNLRNNE